MTSENFPSKNFTPTPHYDIFRRSQRWSMVVTTTLFLLTVQSMLPAGAKVPSTTRLLSTPKTAAPVNTKQLLPAWTPTGRSAHQANATSSLPDFGRTGRPSSHRGGASRGPACDDSSDSLPSNCTNIPVTVLAPTNDGGHTIQATPRLWVYVPYALDAITSIKFALQDSQGNSIYETSPTLNHEAGMLQLVMPDEVVLELAQRYEWFLTIDPDGASEFLNTLSGWVKRVEAPTPSDAQSPEMSIDQRVTLSRQYAEELVWYDALTVLADGLLLHPDDPQLLSAWSELLSNPSVQLDYLSNVVPLGDCCQLPVE